MDIARIGREAVSLQIESLSHMMISDAFAQAVELMQHRPIVITGVGKSGLIAAKIAATLTSLSIPARFIHPVEALHGDMGAIDMDAVILAISHSGQSKEVIEMLSHTHPPVVAMTGDSESYLARGADIHLLVPAIENDIGFPTSSTTCSLVMGDALATALAYVSGVSKFEFQRNHPGGNL